MADPAHAGHAMPAGDATASLVDRRRRQADRSRRRSARQEPDGHGSERSPVIALVPASGSRCDGAVGVAGAPGRSGQRASQLAARVRARRSRRSPCSTRPASRSRCRSSAASTCRARSSSTSTPTATSICSSRSTATRSGSSRTPAPPAAPKYEWRTRPLPESRGRRVVPLRRSRRRRRRRPARRAAVQQHPLLSQHRHEDRPRSSSRGGRFSDTDGQPIFLDRQNIPGHRRSRLRQPAGFLHRPRRRAR